MQSFDVYFLGETLPETDPTAVRQGVAHLFKVQESAVERLFSGKPVRVKQGLDAESASRYRAAFREIGALVQIVPTGSAPPQPKELPTSAGGKATAQPESTGPTIDTSGVSLAEPGAILDHTPPPPAAEIDTSALEALPANTGSLEDCQVEKPHRTIPDISHLRLVDD